jgi:anti-sigma B factor antagonist
MHTFFDQRGHDMPPLHVHDPHIEDGTTTIAVAGDLDMATVDLLRRHIVHALCPDNAPPPAKLVLDLDKVTFLGSVGLALLTDVRRDSQRQGTALALRGARHRTVLRPLEVTGLAALFVLE